MIIAFAVFNEKDVDCVTFVAAKSVNKMLYLSFYIKRTIVVPCDFFRGSLTPMTKTILPAEQILLSTRRHYLTPQLGMMQDTQRPALPALSSTCAQIHGGRGTCCWLPFLLP